MGDSTPSAEKVDASEQDFVGIGTDVIDMGEISKRVADGGAGAISTFLGVTRDNFNGKKVLRLEYEAYEPMALSELTKLVAKVRAKWDVLRVAIVHRLGPVPVGEASVAIAVSSAHRVEGLEAVHFAIDELKATVPVWKKEFYEDGEVWKENMEFHEKRKGCCGGKRTFEKVN